MPGIIGKELNRGLVTTVAAAEFAGALFFDVAYNLDIPDGMEAKISSIDYSCSGDLSVTQFEIYEEIQFSFDQVAAITLNEVLGGLFASRGKLIWITRQTRDGALVFNGNIWKSFCGNPLRLRGARKYGLIGRPTFTAGPPANAIITLSVTGEIVNTISKKESFFPFR